MTRTQHTGTGFILLGGCHMDRQLHLAAPPRWGRTNPAHAREQLGGVAANIACRLAGWGASVRLVGVQPPAILAAMEARLGAANVEPWLIPIEGEPPGYTALLAPDGELVMGAAAMALYDGVSASMIRPGLVDLQDAVILDANFPADALRQLVDELDPARKVFAAGTSIDKVARLEHLLPRLDALVLNRGEAAALTAGNGSEISLATGLAARLRAGGVVLVSNGGDEAALASDERVVAMAPPRIRLVNANGAGDVMAARLFYDLVMDPDMGPPNRKLRARLEAALAAGATWAAGDEMEA